MTRMGQHSAENHAALRRARKAAWTVALSMAGTTMTFQVYHSIKHGHMPWPLAVLYGVVPLLISLCILEFVSTWKGAPAWAQAAAYLIMGGSMYLSAAATGAVVLQAAPPHMSLLFGLLLDAAALLAVHYILNGPRALSKAQEAKAKAERLAEVKRAEADERAALRAELAAARDAHEAEARALQDDLEAERSARADAQREAAQRAGAEAARDDAVAALEAEQDARQAAETARAYAEQQAARADARAARAERKAGAGARADRARKGAGTRAQKDESAVEADVDARTTALGILEKNPGISGAQLGLDCGMSKRWGQDHKAEFMDMLAAFSGAGEGGAE